MGNRSFVSPYRRLNYFAAGDAMIAVGGGPDAYELCHILFGKDGSIYVQFRFARSVEGVVTVLPREPGATGPVILNYTVGGRATSHLVKYSHHPSGRAHTSQSGKTTSEIGRYSFPLHEEGRVFQLSAFHLAGFRPVTKLRQKRCYLPFIFSNGAVPPGVSVTAEWTRKDSILSRTEGRGTVGPVSTGKQVSTGRDFKAFFLGQPKGYPFRHHVLIVSLGVAEVPRGVDEPALVMFGGLDHPAVTPPVPQDPGCLFVMYPSGGDLAERIGTIDLPRPPLS